LVIFSANFYLGLFLAIFLAIVELSTKGRDKMAKFQVTMMVEFVGEIEADTPEEAESLAIYDQTCMYSGVDSIEVDELEEVE